MTPEILALGLLALLFVYASALALSYRIKLDDAVAEMMHVQSNVDIWKATAEQAQLDKINFAREVEQAGYTDHEIQRLRATNNRLAVRVEELEDAITEFVDQLEPTGKSVGEHELLAVLPRSS